MDSKTPYIKKPTTYAEQVKQLQQRGLIITDIHQAEAFLAHVNYYRFAAYCLPFEVEHPNHRFKPNTHFYQLVNLYKFDRELRLLVLDAVECFEVSLRTQLAYHLSHNHQTAHPHLKPELFHKESYYQRGLDKLSMSIEHSPEDFIRHLVDKYVENQPPIWAVVELMTMGQLSNWFVNIKSRADTKAICGVYGLNENIIKSFCQHLCLVRNHAAHHSRLWNRDFTKIPKLPKHKETNLGQSLYFLPEGDKRLRKLYNTFVILSYLLNKITGTTHWLHSITALLQKYAIDTQKMGFPQDWQTRPLWQ